MLMSLQATKSVASYRKTYTYIIYTVPTFSNPSGKVMPLTCRQKLVDVARRHDGLIVSDDIYDMLQWSSTPGKEETTLCNHTPPRFVDIDRLKSHSSTDPASFGNALSIGSLSKIVAPGTRIGWVDADAALVNALGQYGSSLAGGGPTSQLVQGVVVELLRDNWLEHHIKFTLVPAYRTRRQLMVQAIEDHLRPLGVVLEDPPSGAIVGGFFLWLRLPAGVSSHLVRTICAEQELLAICPGADCRVPGDEDVAVWDGFMRLSYSYEEEDNLVEGIVRLARVINVSMK
jgi:DNA-binding transcriptional MocR family regulator